MPVSASSSDIRVLERACLHAITIVTRVWPIDSTLSIVLLILGTDYGMLG